MDGGFNKNMTEEEQYILDAERDWMEDDKRKRCPACGADESKFTTTITSPDGCSYCIECGDCGELIDED